MSIPEIETMLRNPPRVKAPPELLADLQRQIVLPKAPPSRSALPFWKQWIPALSFGALVLGCIVALGIQRSDFIELKRANRTLQEQIAQASGNSDGEGMLKHEHQLTGLSAQEQGEIERLRTEVEQLRQQLQAAEQLRGEQAQLEEQLKAAAARRGDEDPFAAVKDRAETTACLSNLKQISLGARMWANDNKEQFPPDVASMSKLLNTPRVLVCPADTGRLPAAASWEQWQPSQMTYEYLGSGTSERETTLVLVRCPIHGNVALNEGSAHISPKLVNENGRLKLAPLKR